MKVKATITSTYTFSENELRQFYDFEMANADIPPSEAIPFETWVSEWITKIENDKELFEEYFDTDDLLESKIKKYKLKIKC